MINVPRLALSGCGAVVSEYYRYVLAEGERLGKLRVAGLYDPNQDRLAQAANHFPRAGAYLSYDELLSRVKPDLTIIASPPANHTSQAVGALEAGSAVLCEKPMSLDLKGAEAIVAAADRTDRLLAIGMVRRHFPASKALRRIIREKWFGPVLSLDAFEGGPFRWPIRSQDYFSRAVSGGGVLADIGPHILDLLADWLGQGELHGAADDAFDGVEANVELALCYGQVPATIRLSRDWERPNEIRVRMERCVAVWRNDMPSFVSIRTTDGQEFQVGSQKGEGFLECFGAQLDAVLDNLAGRPALIASGAEALHVQRLIEQAYASRGRMDMPWL